MNSKIIDEKSLYSLIRKYSGCAKFNIDDDLEWDLGLTGDDAYELIIEYGRIYHIDVSSFRFEEFFYDEGQHLKLLARRIIRKYQKKKFTTRDLLEGLSKGYIGEQVQAN